MRIALRLVEELGEAACYSAILESGQKNRKRSIDFTAVIR
jgi:hypothetical protein